MLAPGRCSQSMSCCGYGERSEPAPRGSGRFPSLSVSVPRSRSEVQAISRLSGREREALRTARRRADRGVIGEKGSDVGFAASHRRSVRRHRPRENDAPLRCHRGSRASAPSSHHLPSSRDLAISLTLATAVNQGYKVRVERVQGAGRGGAGRGQGRRGWRRDGDEWGTTRKAPCEMDGNGVDGNGKQGAGIRSDG